MSQKDMPPELPEHLLEVLLKDPKKRQLVLQVLGAGEEGFKKFRREQLKKDRERNCESPTAMMRRRQLAKQCMDSDTSSSEQSSEPPVLVPPTAKKNQRPFHELLKGVTAYVEVRRNNEDKSEGIKMIMLGMGAAVKDKFSSDVTHVVFKDGSYTTFQKAKLVKAHLVSVLWLDAVRRNNVRVPEKNYPAIGGEYSDLDVSVLCSQLQKDFEDIITDERRRSLSIVGNKASSSEKDRRRTMFSICSQTSQSSKSSDSLKDCSNATNTSESTLDGNSTNEADKEVARVTSKIIETTSFMQMASPELTSDDSDCGVVDGYNSSHLKDKFLKMQAEQQSLKNSSNDSKSMITSCGKNIKRRGTITLISDMVITPNVNTVINVDIVNQSKSSKSTNISDESARRKLLSDFDDRTMSSLRLSSESNKENSLLATEKVPSDGLKEFSGKPTNDNSSTSQKGKGKARKNVKETTPARKPPSVSQDSVVTSMSSLRLSTPNSKVSPDGNTSLSKSLLNPIVLLKRTPDRSEKETFKKPKRMCASATPKRQEKSSPKRSARKARTVTRKPVSDPEESPPIRKSSRKAPGARKALEYDYGGSPPKKAKTTSSDNNSQSPARSTPSTPTIQKRNLDEAGKSTKKTRKLYDPDEVALARISASNEETERQAKLQELKTRALSKPTPSLAKISASNEETERQAKLQELKTKASSKPTPSQSTVVFKTPVAVARKNTPESSVDSSDMRAIIGTLNELFQSKKDNNKKLNKKAAKKDNVPENKISEVLSHKYLEKAAASESSPSDVTPRSSSNSGSCRTTTSDDSTLPITPIKRRSTMDFQSLPGKDTKSVKRRRMLEEMKKPSIVCTMFHRNESLNFEKAVDELGSFRTEVRVTEKTTHLVVGEAKRTINLLKAIARGCWILKHEWLLDSQRQGRWLDEERYELTEFSRAVQEMRLQRQAFGPGYTMDVFEACGPIYVSNNTRPDSTDLKDLISICGGKLTAMYRNAAIVVGLSVRQDDVKCVSEDWVLDCITFNRLKQVKNYLLKPCNDELNTSRPLSPSY